LVGELQSALSSMSGVINIRSTLEAPASEFEFSLKDEARSMAVDLRLLARQVRQAFYGEEVQRVPQAREDVKVLVRYPRSDREREESLQSMYVRTPSGDAVPLDVLVDIQRIDSFKKIDRLDRQRVARVTADLEPGFDPASIMQKVLDEHRVEWAGRFPDASFLVDGEQKEKGEFIHDLFFYFLLALITIYGMMAVMFNSYWKPLLVVSAIPFAYFGAIYGHLALGIDISMFSMLGMLACAGVVVNDNMVLVDRINKLKSRGMSDRCAVVNAAVQRFRPIVLTSATTFFGLFPILLEQSVQAAFLKPMVISLAVGVVAATFVTLCFVPVLFLTIARIRRKSRVLLGWCLGEVNGSTTDGAIR
jgi:multidrug efflux pump subunit AcrB